MRPESEMDALPRAQGLKLSDDPHEEFRSLLADLAPDVHQATQPKQPSSDMPGLMAAQQADSARADALDDKNQHQGVSDALYAAFTRSKVHPEAAPVARAGEVEKFGQQRALRRQEDTKAKGAVLDDPASEESKMSQGLISRLLSGMPGMPQLTPDQLAKMSHNRLVQMFPFAKEVAEMEHKKNDKGRANNSGMWTALQRDYPDVAARYQDGELSDDAAAKVYRDAGATGRTVRAQTGADTRQTRALGQGERHFKQTFGVTKSLADSALGARESFGAKDLDPEHPQKLSTEQAEHLDDMKAAADTVIEKTQQAKALYGKGGLIVPGSSQEAQLNQLIVETYGPMLKTGNIGNLTDSHLHLLQSMINNPTNWKNYVNDKRFPGLLDALGDAAKRNTEHQANARGKTYGWPGSSAARPAGGAQRVGVGQVDLSGTHHIKTDAEWEALPSGAEYIGPDGVLRRK